MRALLLLCILPLLGLTALAQPALYFLQQDMQRAVTSAALVPGDRLLACLADGSCLILNSTGGIEWSYVFVGALVERILVTGSLAYLIDSTGVLHILNTSSLGGVSSRRLLKQGEFGVGNAAVSGDGRFLAFVARYYYDASSRYPLDRLVVYKVDEGARVFERDAFSSAVLVRVFSLDVWENYLIAETLNTSCHLCELTDNVIEVYRLGSKVQKVSEMRTGLSRVKGISGGYLLVQRALDNSLLLLSLPDLKLAAEKRDAPPMRQVLPLADGFLMVSEEYDLWRCSFALDCRRLAPLPPKSLIAPLASHLVVFSIPEVQVLSLEGDRVVRLAGYDIQWDMAPSPPSSVLAREGSAAALYPIRKLAWLKLLDRSKLLVRVLDPNGRPVADATVRVLSENFFKMATSGARGEVSLEVKPGSYTVEVTKEGYSPWSATVKVDTPYYNLTAVLSRVVLRRGLVMIRVLDAKGNPIPGAMLSFEGSSAASARTDEEGYARVELPTGEYVVEAKAPGYRSGKATLKVDVGGVNATLILEPQVSWVSFVVEGGKQVSVEISSGAAITRLNISGKLSVPLERGLYSFYAQAPGHICRSNVSSPVLLTGDLNITIKVVCERAGSLREPSAEQVAAELSSRVLSYRRLNTSIGSLQVVLVNGSVVDLAHLSSDKTVVVEFFYTQCSGCRDILPTLRRISSMNNTLVVSLTVSPLDDDTALSGYVKENNITWPVGRLSSSDILRRLNITSYPTVAVLRNGEVTFIGIGAKPEEPVQGGVTPSTEVNLPSTLGFLTGLYTPATLITVGLLLSAVALLLGGGHAEEEAKDSIPGDTTFVPALYDSLRGFDSEAVSWHTAEENEQFWESWEE
jgi:thiol-disulfide isomerase/thioredoxin